MLTFSLGLHQIHHFDRCVQDAEETYELDAVADLAIWVKSSIQLLG